MTSQNSQIPQTSKKILLGTPPEFCKNVRSVLRQNYYTTLPSHYQTIAERKSCKIFAIKRYLIPLSGVIAVSVYGRPKPHIFRSYAQKPPVNGSGHPSASGASDTTETQDEVKINSAASFIPGSLFTIEGRFEDGMLDYLNPSVVAFLEVNRMYKAYHQDTYANFQSEGEPQGTRSGVAFLLSIGAGNSAMIPSGLEDRETKHRERMSSLTENSH